LGLFLELKLSICSLGEFPLGGLEFSLEIFGFELVFDRLLLELLMALLDLMLELLEFGYLFSHVL
jgi:hypothetical protein